MYTCEICNRLYTESDVVLLHLDYSSKDKITLRRIEKTGYAGIRSICKHCVKIIKDINKTPKIEVNYDELMDMLSKIQAINKLELKDIQWVRKDGTIIKVTQEEIDNWKYVGMTNVAFAEINIPDVSKEKK